MNGLARVGISLLLLGACAVAMRFTMVNVDLPHTKRKLHTGKVDTSKAKKIELQIGLRNTTAFYMKSGVAGRIAGTFQSTDANHFHLRDSTNSTRPIVKDLTRIDLETGMRSYNNFFTTRPNTDGGAELRLPTDVPLEILVISDLFGYPQQRTNLFFDLRGVDIQRFSFPHGASNPVDMVLEMPKGSLKTDFWIKNDFGQTRVNFDQASQGNLNIESNNGLADIRMSSETSINVVIMGKATNAKAFRQRLTNMDPNIVWEEPQTNQVFVKGGWYMTGKTKNTNQNAFRFLIQLGENGRVSL